MPEAPSFHPESTEEYKPAAGPVYELFTWRETAPYSSQWYRASEYVVAPTPDAALALATLEPGYGNAVRAEPTPAFETYWDKLETDIEATAGLIESKHGGIEEYIESDPTRYEHLIYSQFYHLLTSAQNSQAWLEKFAQVNADGNEVVPQFELHAERWQAILQIDDMLRDQIEATRDELAKPNPDGKTILELFRGIEVLADRAMTTISEGAEGEHRRCKDCHGSSPMSAGFRIKLLEPHDRSLDNDIFCGHHADEKSQAYQAADKPIEMIKLGDGHQGGLPVKLPSEQ